MISVGAIAPEWRVCATLRTVAGLEEAISLWSGSVAARGEHKVALSCMQSMQASRGVWGACPPQEIQIKYSRILDYPLNWFAFQ